MNLSLTVNFNCLGERSNRNKQSSYSLHQGDGLHGQVLLLPFAVVHKSGRTAFEHPKELGI